MKTTRFSHLGSERPSLNLQPSSTARTLEEMSHTGFQGRNLGEAFSVWRNALRRRHTVIFLGLSGAMVPAGMGPFLRFLIETRAIDVLVSTGANLSHDVYLGLGGRHLLARAAIDDERLRQSGMHRIYDVYETAHGLDKVEDWVAALVQRKLGAHRTCSTREITRLMGSELSKTSRGQGTLLSCAFRAGVPVFVPALGDSTLGSGIMLGRRKFGGGVVIDMIRDLEEIVSLSAAAPEAGVIFIGGGVPKNYIQQSAVIASYQTRHDRRYRFGLQFTTDAPQWGGLSGSTFAEAISWGKYRRNATFVTCYVDATVVLPLLTMGLASSAEIRSRVYPEFLWDSSAVRVRFPRRSHR